MLDLKATTETQEKLRKLLQNRDWLNENIKKVQADYAEKWVAIAEGKVVATGPTADKVKEELAGKYSPEEVLEVQIPSGEIGRSLPLT